MPGYPVSRYRKNQILTASPEQILLALYDGAIRFAQQARQAVIEIDPATKGKSCDRVIAILSELSSTLDHERSPRVCSDLYRLYCYLIERLNHGSAYLDIEPIDEVIGHLRDLRDTWVLALEGSRDAANPGRASEAP